MNTARPTLPLVSQFSELVCVIPKSAHLYPQQMWLRTLSHFYQEPGTAIDYTYYASGIF